MCFESKRLEKQIKLLESQIKELPQGKLICARNDNRWKWYCSDGHKSVYIPKKEQQFAEKLAKKKYLSLLVEDMRQEKEMQDWINSQYETCKKYPENLIFKTASGNMVRSKSEVMIDMALYTNAIPFRYECEINLGEMVIYPDFTIKHPKTGKIYYWEHFGRMDDEKYAKHAAAKLKNYIESGIVPNIDLITTYETKECPLDYESIEKVVKEYFC